VDAATFAGVQLAFFAAALLKGVTGLGFSTLGLGLLAVLVDVRVAIPLVVLPSLMSNVVVMVDAGRFRAATARFWPLYLAVLPGLAVGLWLLGASDGTGPRRLLGVVLALYGLFGLLVRDPRLVASWEGSLKVPVGVVNGVINGLTGSQVMPLLPYLLALRLHPDLLVQALNSTCTLASLAMLAGLTHLGLLTPPVLLASVVGAGPVALGVWLGARLRRRLPEGTFRILVLGLLVALGVLLVLRS
jgi:uncharacterized protein